MPNKHQQHAYACSPAIQRRQERKGVYGVFAVDSNMNLMHAGRDARIECPVGRNIPVAESILNACTVSLS
jgi:hypothetical protein